MERIPARMLIPCGQRIKKLIAKSFSQALMGMAANNYINALLEAFRDCIPREPEACRILGMYYLFAFENKFFRQIIFSRAGQNFIKKAV
jgi:hypothetical protein